MARTISQSSPCGIGEERGECDPRLVLEVVNDDDARALFLSATSPTTVTELSAELDLPLSTTYRKVNDLEEAGLLREVPGTHEGSARYVRSTDRVTVTYDDPIRIQCVKSGLPVYCEL